LRSSSPQEGARKNSDPGFVLRHYINHPDRIQCSVAIDDKGGILGFQSLKIARQTNPYGTPVGWGIIGTHVRPTAARRGVGRCLFSASQHAARSSGLEKIEAFIGADNEAALTYYEAMGFRSYRRKDGAICKAYEVPAPT
jgi:ribosomal protein S18 acetylase RimI-like enzyme